MGRGSSKVGGGGAKQTPRTKSSAEELKVGDVISPEMENWTIHLSQGKTSGHINHYITVDSIKVGPKTVNITGHYDLSGNYEVGSEYYKAGKNKLVKVTKQVKKGTIFKLRR